MEKKSDEYWGSMPSLSLINFNELLFKRNPGGVFEVRILGIDGINYTGYFDNAESIVKALLPLSESPRTKIPFNDYPRITEANHYVTMNPIAPDLLARSANRFMRAKSGNSASNEDCAIFSLFFIDIDPKRKSGISANDSERRAARKVWIRIRRDLRKRGIRPIPASSGNGYHLLILTQSYTGDDIAKAAERGKKILEYLQRKFGTDTVDVDTSVCTPAHLIKMYGSLAMKGSDIQDRPHRYATIEIPDSLPPDVDIFSIYRDEIEAPQQSATPTKDDSATQENCDVEAGVRASVNRMESFLIFTGFEYTRIDKSTLHVFTFKTCPYHEDSDNHEYECSVTVSRNDFKTPNGSVIPAGVWGANCFHDANAGWQEFKEALGWDAYVKKLRHALDPTEDEEVDIKYRQTSLETTDLFLKTRHFLHLEWF
jgi:hypothetical protein